MALQATKDFSFENLCLLHGHYGYINPLIHNAHKSYTRHTICDFLLLTLACISLVNLVVSLHIVVTCIPEHNAYKRLDKVRYIGLLTLYLNKSPDLTK